VADSSMGEPPAVWGKMRAVAGVRRMSLLEAICPAWMGAKVAPDALHVPSTAALARGRCMFDFDFD
jgi:hypothetical protein